MSKWISVEDRLPEDGTAVIICSWEQLDESYYDEDKYLSEERLRQWGSGHRYQHIATYKGRPYNEWFVHFSTCNRNNSAHISLSFRTFEDGNFPITHWMPLPEPPEGK